MAGPVGVRGDLSARRRMVGSPAHLLHRLLARQRTQAHAANPVKYVTVPCGGPRSVLVPGAGNGPLLSADLRVPR